MSGVLRAQRGREPAMNDLNIYNEDDVQRGMLACAYAGVALGFRHIALRHIIEPPHEWFDAMLARQIAMHILASRFGVPRRRIETMVGRGRQGIRAAINTVDSRLEDPVFEQAYRRMAQRAANLFNHQIEQARAA